MTKKKKKKKKQTKQKIPLLSKLCSSSGDGEKKTTINYSKISILILSSTEDLPLTGVSSVHSKTFANSSLLFSFFYFLHIFPYSPSPCLCFLCITASNQNHSSLICLLLKSDANTQSPIEGSISQPEITT